MSLDPLASSVTRSEASLSKSRVEPSALIIGLVESLFPVPNPSRAALRRMVRLRTRSRRKTSLALFVSPGTRSEARLRKITWRPSEERTGAVERPLPDPVPRELTLTRVDCPVVRSMT